MPGVREEVHGQKEYDVVLAEKSFRVDREDLVVASFRCGCCGSEATDALEEVFGVREITIRTWLCRSGMLQQLRSWGKKLHERFMAELELVHVQLDELWANVKDFEFRQTSVT